MWSSPSPDGRRPGRVLRPQLEQLEDRTVPGLLAPVSYAVDPNPVAVATGDFDGDGVWDLVTASGGFGSGGGTGTVSVLSGRGDGSFRPPRPVSLGYRIADSVAVGDVNADGKLDLVAGTQANLYSPFPYDSAFEIAPTVLLGNGDGTFQPARRFVADYARFYAAPSDTNFYMTSVPSRVALGDFNRDGTPDLAVTSGQRSHDDLEGDYMVWDHVTVLLGRGDGTFTAASQTTVNDEHLVFGGVRLAVGDANGDGAPDLATSSGDLLLGQGDGTFRVTQVGTGGNDVVLADLDGDSLLDLVAVGLGVGVFRGNGDGTFQGPSSYAVPGAASVAAGDFNRDGKPDLVTADTSTARVSVLLNNGDGTFRPLAPSATGSIPVAVAVGDFSRDGWLDAATANGTANTASVLINDGSWPSSNQPSISIGDVTVVEGDTGAVSVVFTVSLSAAFGQPVTVNYATADGTAIAGSDYATMSGTLTFAPGEISKTITVLVYGDRLSEPNETFFLNLSQATNATLGNWRGLGSIVDDEPRISISDVTRAEGKKNRTTLFTFTVTLSVPYDQPVTVSFQTANGTADTSDNDYVAQTGTVTFAPGETTKTITIEVKGDSKREADEYFFLDLFDNSSNSLLGKSRGVGGIWNDD